MVSVIGSGGAGDVGALYSQEDGSDALIAELKVISHQGAIEVQRAALTLPLLLFSLS